MIDQTRMQVQQAFRRFDFGITAPRRIIIAMGLAVSVLMPTAHGLARMQISDAVSLDHAQAVSPKHLEQNKNTASSALYQARLDALANHAFPVSPRVDPMPRPKPRGLRKRRTEALKSAAVRIAHREGVPPELFLALIHAESSFNPYARSHVGAMGLTQLMPATARELGVDPRDPMQNMAGGARYLRLQHERFGSWQLALAAYNAGPTRVARLGRIPNITETKNYVSKIITMASL